MAAAEVGGVAHIDQRLLALLQRRLHLLAEPLVGERAALAGNKFAVEPGRAVMADLAVKASGRQDADADVGAVAGEVVGLAALGKIGGDAPVIRIDPLDMAGPAQRLQPADVGADERLRVAAHAVDGGARPLQMRRRPIDALRRRRCP